MTNTSLRPLRLGEFNTSLGDKDILGVRHEKSPVLLVWTLSTVLAFHCSLELGSSAMKSQNTHLPSKPAWVSAAGFLCALSYGS